MSAHPVVPSFYDWDAETRTSLDRLKRHELTHAVVEYVAPQEYMVRPPQPCVFVFVIDVTYAAVQNGMVATAARTILDSLDGLPNDDNRTKVMIVTVDQALHFYSLNSAQSEPQMLVVSDLDDPFIPQPEDLLINLGESRPQLEALLERLGDMFKSTQQTQNALGAALQVVFKLIQPIGGKIVILQSSLPSVGPGALKPREDPKLLGTAKEVTLLNPQSPFYKQLAVDCSRAQVGMDVFVCGGQYNDVATL
ncbi:COPII subunit, partial [Gonapodya sp. JEL0774]